MEKMKEAVVFSSTESSWSAHQFLSDPYLPYVGGRPLKR